MEGNEVRKLLDIPQTTINKLSVKAKAERMSVKALMEKILIEYAEFELVIESSLYHSRMAPMLAGAIKKTNKKKK